MLFYCLEDELFSCLEDDGSYYSETFTAAIPSCRLPTLPTAYCLLLTAYCLLPTAYCLLPTAATATHFLSPFAVGF